MRIYYECESRREKSVARITVCHHSAGPGVEFEKKAFGSSKLGKFDAV